MRGRYDSLEDIVDEEEMANWSGRVLRQVLDCRYDVRGIKRSERGEGSHPRYLVGNAYQIWKSAS